MSSDNGSVAIVTGAGRGIGYGIAQKLAEAGYKVLACDNDSSSVEASVQSITKAGGTAISVVGDVGNHEDVKRIVKIAVDTWGRVDILVNNAGINRDAMLHKMTDEQWDDVIRVNLKGSFMMMREVQPIMRTQNYGRIINISSSASGGRFGQANYSSSKAAINALTKVGAIEMARYGITVNAILPGPIYTDMVRSLPTTVVNRWVQIIPQKKIGEVGDVANAVMFFAGEESAYITGQIMWVDGGMELGGRS